MAADREWRIDLFRGLALAMIFINHIPDNPLAAWTSSNFGFSDAAEGFVLMAGIAAAVVYLPRFRRDGAVRSGARAWRRAFDLYVAHLMCVLLVSGMIAYAALAADDPRFLAWINLGPVFEDPAAALIGLVTLGHQPGYLNILPLYVCLLMAMPAMLPLAASRPGLLLTLSGGVWAAANLWGLNLPQWPTDDEWFFNPLAWQFLFAIGLVVGTRIAQGLPVLPRWRWLLPAALAYLLLGAVLMWDQSAVWPELPIPWFLYQVDKTYLSLPRLLHVLAIGVVLARLPAIAQGIARIDRPGWLVLLGRQALPVFCLGSVLAIAAQLLRFLLDAGPWLEVALVVGGLALQVALARLLTWLDRDKAGSRRPAPSPPQAAEAA